MNKSEGGARTSNSVLCHNMRSRVAGSKFKYIREVVHNRRGETLRPPGAILTRCANQARLQVQGKGTRCFMQASVCSHKDLAVGIKAGCRQYSQQNQYWKGIALVRRLTQHSKELYLLQRRLPLSKQESVAPCI